MRQCAIHKKPPLDLHFERGGRVGRFFAPMVLHLTFALFATRGATRARTVHTDGMELQRRSCKSNHVERLRNPHFIGITRNLPHSVAIHRKHIKQMVNRVLTSPFLCYPVVDAAGGPAVHDV
jgi:hypothetical protein